MSGVIRGVKKAFKAVGKVIKGAVKVVTKIAPYALAAAAVVMTGGAALGLGIPTFAAGVGSLVGGLGLSAGVTTALTGSIVGAGFGAATGGLLGGKKGMMSGMLMGGLTGGLMPTSMPGMGAGSSASKILGYGIKPTDLLAQGSQLSSTINGLADPVGQAAAGSAAGASSGAAGLLAPGSALAKSIGGLGAAPIVNAPGMPVTLANPPAAPVLAGAGGAGGGAQATGMAGLFGANPQLASQLLGGVASAFGGNEYRDAARARSEADREAGYFAFGGGRVDGKDVPGVYSRGTDPFGIREMAAPPSIRPENYVAAPVKRWMYDPSSNTVKEVAA
jgi:hypothetical protein